MSRSLRVGSKFVSSEWWTLTRKIWRFYFGFKSRQSRVERLFSLPVVLERKSKSSLDDKPPQRCVQAHSVLAFMPSRDRDSCDKLPLASSFFLLTSLLFHCGFYGWRLSSSPEALNTWSTFSGAWRAIEFMATGMERSRGLPCSLDSIYLLRLPSNTIKSLKINTTEHDHEIKWFALLGRLHSTPPSRESLCSRQTERGNIFYGVVARAPRVPANDLMFYCFAQWRRKDDKIQI